MGGAIEGEPEPVSYRLEQSPSELAYLKGAKVTAVKKRASTGEYDTDCLLITFELAEPIMDGETNEPASKVDLEVWQDPEGNGPGYLALVGMRK